LNIFGGIYRMYRQRRVKAAKLAANEMPPFCDYRMPTTAFQIASELL